MLLPRKKFDFRMYYCEMLILQCLYLILYDNLHLTFPERKKLAFSSICSQGLWQYFEYVAKLIEVLFDVMAEIPCYAIILKNGCQNVGQFK